MTNWFEHCRHFIIWLPVGHVTHIVNLKGQHFVKEVLKAWIPSRIISLSSQWQTPEEYTLAALLTPNGCRTFSSTIRVYIYTIVMKLVCKKCHVEISAWLLQSSTVYVVLLHLLSLCISVTGWSGRRDMTGIVQCICTNIIFLKASRADGIFQRYIVAM